MKQFFIQTIFLLVVIIGALYYWSNNFQSPGGGSPRLPFANQPTKKEEIMLGNTIFQIEVADDAQTRATGLGGRENLASGSGMLFVFPKSDEYGFWMKGMRFPLDLIFIQKDKIVDIIKNVPPPAAGTPENKLPVYKSKLPADQVVELNAGDTDKFGIKVSDSFQVVNK